MSGSVPLSPLFLLIALLVMANLFEEAINLLLIPWFTGLAPLLAVAVFLWPKSRSMKKSNEITAIPQLLDMIDIAGCTISIDAMGCQKDIAAKMISKKADDILAVQDNQPALRLDALLMSKHCRADDDFIDTDAGHGRVETRRSRI